MEDELGLRRRAAAEGDAGAGDVDGAVGAEVGDEVAVSSPVAECSSYGSGLNDLQTVGHPGRFGSGGTAHSEQHDGHEQQAEHDRGEDPVHWLLPGNPVSDDLFEIKLLTSLDGRGNSIQPPHRATSSAE